MRALVFDGPWQIGTQHREDPVPAADEVLIEVHATGICGSDIHGFTGENGRRHPGQVMGHETVGRVVQVGAEVTDLRAGATVTVNPVIACGDCPACHAHAEQSCPQRRVIGVHPDLVSAFAELMTVPAGNVVELPESMPTEYGALVEPLAVGFHAAVRGQCSDADRVLVIGGGPIGQACALAAQRLGVDHLVVTEPNPRRRDLVAALGARAIDPSNGDADEAVTAALGGPATLVLDAVGTTGSVEDAVRCSSFGAGIVLVGMNAPRIDLAAYAVSTEERSLIGSFCYSADDFRQTARWVGTSPPQLAHLVDGRVDLDTAAGAFSDLARGDSQASKVLVFLGGTTNKEQAR
jgi:2-desacetyl-2-hydroxyethyl bacteriochlorophyllide A dehydrogenase